MKKTFASIISALLLAIMIIQIPYFGINPNAGTGVETCSDLEEDVFHE